MSAMDPKEISRLCRIMKLALPFAGVPFNADGRANDVGDDGLTPNNGERAQTGQFTLALHHLLSEGEQGYRALTEYACEVNLTEAPDEALTDLLANLMHYCHREGIDFGEALATAAMHFDEESGGAIV
jgi:hypothetical protein